VDAERHADQEPERKKGQQQRNTVPQALNHSGLKEGTGDGYGQKRHGKANQNAEYRRDRLRQAGKSDEEVQGNAPESDPNVGAGGDAPSRRDLRWHCGAGTESGGVGFRMG
jgi:hypothetical protein